MINKEQIKCRYKFQDKEKFDGKPYCLCFCEVCEDLPPCDNNCQIYEDFKQLVYKTQIINEIEELIKPYQEPIELDALSLPGAIESILERQKQECEELKYENQKLEMQLCNDCGEKDDYNIPCKMIRDLNYYLQKEIDENDCYRKALEEIREAIAIYSSRHQFSIANDLYNQILDIINKAKDR